MDKRHTVGLVGALLLIAGPFAPVLSIPVLGNITYVKGGDGDGVFIVGLGVISLLLVFTLQYRALYLTGLSALAFMGYSLLQFQSRMSEAKADLVADLEGNAFSGFADAAVNAVSLEWGWAVMLTGGLLVLACAHWPKMNNDSASSIPRG